MAKSDGPVTTTHDGMKEAGEGMTVKGRRTRESLIDAARRIAAHQGVGAVNVMAVCDAAGVGRTSFYNYFSDTDALLELIGAETVERFHETFEGIHGDLPRGLCRLMVCLSKVFQLAVDVPEDVLLLTELAEVYEMPGEMVRQQIRAEIEGAAQTGDIRLSRREITHYADFAARTTLALARAFAQGDYKPSEVMPMVRRVVLASGVHHEVLAQAETAVRRHRPR